MCDLDHVLDGRGQERRDYWLVVLCGGVYRESLERAKTRLF